MGGPAPVDQYFVKWKGYCYAKCTWARGDHPDGGANELSAELAELPSARYRVAALR